MTAHLGRGRSFSFANLNDQTGKANQYQTKLKQLCVCNHWRHLPSSGKCRPPTVYGSALPAPFGAALFYHENLSLSIFPLPAAPGPLDHRRAKKAALSHLTKRLADVYNENRKGAADKRSAFTEQFHCEMTARTRGGHFRLQS